MININCFRGNSDSIILVVYVFLMQKFCFYTLNILKILSGLGSSSLRDLIHLPYLRFLIAELMLRELKTNMKKENA